MQASHTSPQRLTDGLKNLAEHKYKAAHESAIQMIHQKIDDPVPYLLLGMIAAEHGNSAKALELFEKASKFEARDARYAAYFARALTTHGDQLRAKNIIDRAATLEVCDAHTADTIGVVYSRTGFHELAIPFFEKAIALDDSISNFFFNLAVSQQFSDFMDEAQQSYLAAIALDPKNYRAYTGLVGLKSFHADAEFEQTLKQLIKDPDTDADQIQHLGHALAKICEDDNRHPESLEWLQKGKRKKASSVSYSVDTDLKNFQAAKTTAIKTAPQSDCLNKAPIFIIGMPRTGTTLVDRIISSHADVTSAGELNVFAAGVKTQTATSTPGVLDPQTLKAANSIDLAQVGRTYIERTNHLKRGAARMIDKMSFNLFNAALIHRALPNARIIALRRGAMDSCLSNYRQLFSAKTPYYHYALNLTDTAKFYAAFDDLMAHWRTHIPADRFMEVRYEDIVFDQENQTRRLLDFCSLDWDEACMRFHENSTPVSTASSVQVRQPLYSGSIGRWKKYGDSLDGLKEALGPLADS